MRERKTMAVNCAEDVRIESGAILLLPLKAVTIKASGMNIVVSLIPPKS